MNLITDRTAADVVRWKTLHDKGWEAMSAEEQSEWLGGMKGSYNYTDMNRVESAVKELEARSNIKSVLIICPKPLITEEKWSSEMKRFDYSFINLDGNLLNYCIDLCFGY